MNLDNKIIVFIGGDFCPIGRAEETIMKEDFEVLFGGLEKQLNDVDLRVLNLEAPFTRSERPIAKSGPNIKANPTTVKALSYLGIDLVTLANNHIMDYGDMGLQSTLNVCNINAIATVGAGLSREAARKPFLFQKGDFKIAVLNFAENEYNFFGNESGGANVVNVISNFKDIQQAKELADRVIVIYHGGREHHQLPTPRQRERLRFYVDAGADMVIGHHTHCFSGFEIYKDSPIFYSLGNFLFDYKRKYQKGLWTQGFALKLSVGIDSINFQLIPFFQGREESPHIQLMDGKQKEEFFLKVEELNHIIACDELFYKYWKDYLSTQKKFYLSTLTTPNKYIRFLKAKGYLPMGELPKEHRNVLLNILRCETHHEIMMSILEESYLNNER